MGNTIKLKNSGVSSSVPTSLEHGELAINYADGKIFYKDSSNTIVELSASVGSIDWSNVNNKPDPVITVTLTGDVSGTANATLTDLGNGTITISSTIADDSHNHIISNVDGLQTALDGKAESSHTHSYLPLSGGTVTGLLTASGGIDGFTLSNGISGTNFNITGVNQIEIADPGEGIIWKSGASGDISLIVVDDASDNILRTTAAQFQVGTSTVWHSGNDGSGSGLDADTLDGIQGANFLRSDTSDSMTGTLTATAFSGPLTGNVTGNASTATKLATARTISLTGDVTGSASFDGSANASITATVADDSHNHIISNVDGLQTALDGKLSSSSYTAADVLSKISTVDGAGSGLDADLLDGLDSSVFTRHMGSITSQDWNTFATGNVSSFYGVSNMTGSNKPPAYGYGIAVNYSSSGQGKLQIYAPHNGSDGGNGLWFRSGWNTEYDAWAEIWHSNNDGSGSGLDADLLDGNHASAFATSGHTHSYLPLSGGTLTGQLTMGTSASIRQSSTTWTGNPGSGVGKLEYHSNRWYVVAGSNSSEVARFRRDGSDVGHIANDGRLNFPFWSTTGRNYSAEWIQFDNHSGLYSPLNSAHFFPNSGSYGSWRVQGTRNSWQGLEFDTSNGQFSLMMTANGNNYTGVHHNGSGWKWYFINQDLYCNAYRGFNNVAGTGNASYHPNGIYSTGTNWLYGTINTNGNSVNAGNYNGSRMFLTYNSTGNVGNATINIGNGNGSGVILAFNPSNYAPLITCGQGEILYVRNYLNSGWATLTGYLNNVSSIHYKENVVTLGDAPKPVGSMSNPIWTFDAIDIIHKLRPVSFHWKEQDALPRIPANEDGTPNQRRIGALSRLNKMRKNRGLDDFSADYLRHVCGRDCEGSSDSPCWRYLNYVTGKIGFIAQEVGEVLPQAAELSEERNEYEYIDPVALVAVCVKALQDIEVRLSLLEASNE